MFIVFNQVIVTERPWFYGLFLSPLFHIYMLASNEFYFIQDFSVMFTIKHFLHIYNMCTYVHTLKILYKSNKNLCRALCPLPYSLWIRQELVPAHYEEHHM